MQDLGSPKLRTAKTRRPPLPLARSTPTVSPPKGPSPLGSTEKGKRGKAKSPDSGGGKRQPSSDFVTTEEDGEGSGSDGEGACVLSMKGSVSSKRSKKGKAKPKMKGERDSASPTFKKGGEKDSASPTFKKGGRPGPADSRPGRSMSPPSERGRSAPGKAKWKKVKELVREGSFVLEAGGTGPGPAARGPPPRGDRVPAREAAVPGEGEGGGY